MFVNVSLKSAWNEMRHFTVFACVRCYFESVSDHNVVVISQALLFFSLCCCLFEAEFPRLLEESPGLFCKIYRTSSGKYWRMILVLKSLGNLSLRFWNLLGRGCNDADVDTKIFTSAHLVFVVCSYSDKTFFFTTCDSDEHCSMDATVTLLYVE